MPQRIPLALAVRATYFLTLLSGLTLCVVTNGLAQSDPAAGVLPFSSQVGGGYDHVDMATGNITVTIPVRNKNGKIPFAYDIVGNSHAYWIYLGQLGYWRVGSDSTSVDHWLWGTFRAFFSLNFSTKGYFCSGHPDDIEYYNLAVVDSTGAHHQVTLNGGVDKYGCLNQTLTATATDGSGYTLKITSANPLTYLIYDRSGKHVSSQAAVAGTTTDPDGAQITAMPQGSSTVYTDTLGQQVLTQTIGNPLGNTDKFSYNDANLNPQTVEVDFTKYYQKTVFGCNGIQDIDSGGVNVEFPTLVKIPGGTVLPISYEQTPGYGSQYTTGRVAKLTLPTGGSISYSYSGGNNGVDCTSQVVPTLTRTVDDNNGNVSLWKYVNTNNRRSLNFTVTETDPVHNQTVHSFAGMFQTQAAAYQGGCPTSIAGCTGGGTLLKNTTTCYGSNGSAPPIPPNCSAPAIVPLLPITETDIYTSFNTSSNNRVKTTYDATYGNVTSVLAYDFGATTPTSQEFIFYGQSWNGTACNPYASGTYIFDTPCYSHTENSSGADVSRTQIGYSSTGHPTTNSRWVSGSNWLNSSATYGTNGAAAGVLSSETDANNTTTSFGNFTCEGMLPTLTSLPVDSLSTSQIWDCNGGVVTSSTDANKRSTTYAYNDPRWRLNQISYPDGGQTTMTYNDTANPPNIAKSKLITTGMSLTTQINFDGLHRPIRTLITSDPEGTDYTDTTYDLLGRIYQASNPYRSASDPTYGVTTYGYDALSRIILVTQPDVSKVSTSYLNNCTTVTDEAGKVRASCVDGLGRLTSVREDPNGSNYETDYAYDALNNLLCAVQKGSDKTQFTNCASASATWRPRSFTYDFLSRLLCAANPEIQLVTCPTSPTGTFPTGAITYTYDGNGNVRTKTAPKPNQTGSATVVTTYSYDNLNRLTQKSYNDSSTPTVKFGYDGVALSGCITAPPSLTDSNPSGYRTSMCDGSGATSWSHDVMGRVAMENRTICCQGATKTITYAPYNLDGSLATLTYPSGRTVTYTSGGAGRPLSAVETAHSLNYVTGATYAPQGALSGLSSGVSIFGGFSYNNRLQPLQVYYGNVAPPALTGTTCPSLVGSIMHRIYNYNSGVDNGNVLSIADCQSPDRTQNFDYDNLNRLKDAYTTGSGTTVTNWGETYTIDPWANLTNIASYPGKQNSEMLNQAPASVNNQLPGFGYDAAGNMTSNGATIYAYDAENRLVNAAGYGYVYDGDDKRVIKGTELSGTLYWTGTGSDPLTETDFTGALQYEYVFFNGKRVARRNASGQGITVYYYFSDHLGSTDVITGSGGAIQKVSAYYPFGGEISVTGPSFANHYKFTGKERDSESGLDNFGKRYDASSLGRFMTPDAFYKDTHVDDPQSWNEYAYARNNPLRYVDPNGEKADLSTSCTTTTDQTTCNVNITASFSIYAQQGSNLTQYQLNQAASTIQSSIQNAWSGSFTQDGVTYNVSTQVSVSVAGSQDAAMSSGAQNVIGLSNGPADAAHNADSFVSPRSLFGAITGQGPDTGVFNINSLASGIAAHEFTHLLGVANKPGLVLSNTTILDPNAHIPHAATAADFQWGIREAVNSVNMARDMIGNCGNYCGLAPSNPHISTTDTVSAPWYWWK